MYKQPLIPFSERSASSEQSPRKCTIFFLLSLAIFVVINYFIENANEISPDPSSTPREFGVGVDDEESSPTTSSDEGRTLILPQLSVPDQVRLPVPIDTQSSPADASSSLNAPVPLIAPPPQPQAVPLSPIVPPTVGSLSNVMRAPPGLDDPSASRDSADDEVRPLPVRPLPAPYSIPVNAHSSLRNVQFAARPRGDSPYQRAVSPTNSIESHSSAGSGVPLLARHNMGNSQSLQDLPRFAAHHDHSRSAEANLHLQGLESSPPARPGPDPHSDGTEMTQRLPVASQPVQDAEEIAPQEVAADIPPAPAHANCGDIATGYEARVGPCSSVKLHTIHLTARSKIHVPLVVDDDAQCLGPTCTKKDKWTCCRKRRRCIHLLNDVPTGCPDGMTPNPYEYAYCKTSPCRMQDVQSCCVEYTGVLLERLAWRRSDRARIHPDTASQLAEPQISFGQHQVAWIDINRKRAVEGEWWAPLHDFMDSWGPGYGWPTDAWIQLTRDGKDQYRDMKLKIHGLSCTTTVNDLMDARDSLVSSDSDTYIVECPRFCMGKPEIFGTPEQGMEWYRWKVNKQNPDISNGIPLFDSPDDIIPIKHGKFKETDTFVSQVDWQPRGNRLWVKVRLKSEGAQGRFYYMPIVAEDDQRLPPFRVYANQVVSEVKGCGGIGFMEQEWFTSDSPVCVAARTLNLAGGTEELLEVTLGPKQPSYQSCTHGGIQTAALADTSAVRRSYRLGPHGFEMAHRSFSYIGRTVRSLWKAHMAAVEREGYVRVFMKWGGKVALYYNLQIIGAGIAAGVEPLEGTGWPMYLVMVILCLFRPLIGLSISITIDTTIDFWHPRLRTFFNEKLDLGPHDGLRIGRIEHIGQILCRQMKAQYGSRIYIPFVMFEFFGEALKLLQITQENYHFVTLRIAYLEMWNRFKRSNPHGTYPDLRPAGRHFPGIRFPWEKKWKKESSVGAGEEDPKMWIDYSHAFLNKVSTRIRELFQMILPREGEEEDEERLSRLDVFAWMAGIDLTKISAEDDVEAAVEEQCMNSPTCILKDFTMREDGSLSIGSSAIPALADNLGIDWELRQTEVDDRTIIYFALQHEDMAQNARILNKMCPNSGTDGNCPSIELTIQEQAPVGPAVDLQPKASLVQQGVEH